MRNVYLSFLGLGSFKKDVKQYVYDKIVYELNGKKSSNTEFVQVAEIQILGAGNFDKIIIVTTQKAHDTHFETLESQLIKAGAENITRLIISEEMTPEAQWKWFEQILEVVESGDNLTIDLTHGYRSIPIIFSTAVNFLQKARHITLNAVYYGAFEKEKELAPIINMKDFYIINEWAEAVSRLVEDADARKIAEVASKTGSFQAGELNDSKLIAAFENLTNLVRNVDIQNISEEAAKAVQLIEDKDKGTSITGKILLKLITDKFTSITADKSLSGKYDKTYFDIQLEVIRLLLEHKLFMQAYTAMREFIGSIGLIKIKKAKTNNNEGRKKRRYAEIFINMFQIEKNEWNFKGKETEHDKLLPFYNELEKIGIESILRKFTGELADYRNGFDHAWTSKDNKAYPDIEGKGDQFYENLKEVVRLLEKNNILL
jgi:CRISPR-associated Csx2 family protein